MELGRDSDTGGQVVIPFNLFHVKKVLFFLADCRTALFENC